MTSTQLTEIDAVGSTSTAASIGSVLSSFLLHPELQGVAYVVASVSGVVAIVLGVVRIYYTIKNGGNRGDS